MRRCESDLASVSKLELAAAGVPKVYDVIQRSTCVKVGGKGAIVVNVCGFCLAPQGGHAGARLGEAQHPGPHDRDTARAGRTLDAPIADQRSRRCSTT